MRPMIEYVPSLLVVILIGPPLGDIMSSGVFLKFCSFVFFTRSPFSSIKIRPDKEYFGKVAKLLLEESGPTITSIVEGVVIV